MKKGTILFLVLVGIFYCLSTVCAHQQVVVVPLGGSNNSPTNSSTIIGSWWLGGENLISNNETHVVTFLNSTHYIIAEVGGTPEFEGGGPGTELGTYTWNTSSGEFVATVLEETNGDWGFAELNTPGEFILSLNGNTLTIKDVADPSDISKFYRITP